ncbi:MAG: hypothetical protein J5J00_14410 [Deltaproteobacteria bacterium]|nr:hypothetical protein [Deltaproteobacteria bacterium]
MRFLFDLTHPAVVHIFLPVIEQLKSRGHEIEIVSRDKDLTTTLLDEANLRHTVLSRATSGKFNMLLELAKREIGMLRIVRRFKPHLIAGTSANAARVGLYTGTRSAIVNEDDAAIVPLFRWSAYPFSSAIITPQVLAFENYGPRHLTYPAFEKLFYLHPNRFKADPAVHEQLAAGSPDGEYIIFRFSALRAHHDEGATGLGIDLVNDLIDYFAPQTNIWLSSENQLPAEWQKFAFPLPRMKMHSALAKAQVLLCDSQSMSVEAGVLGVKSLRLNSFVGKLSVLKELDRRGLTEGFCPQEEGKYLARVKEYYANRAAEDVAQKERHVKLLRETIDPLPWFCEVIESLAKGDPLEKIYKMDAAFSNANA